MSTEQVVLSLCDLSSNSVKFWAESGFECWCVDTQHPQGIGKLDDNIRKIGLDIRDFNLPNDLKVIFMSSFPPCTHFAVSGARWFKGKGLKLLAESIEIVARCSELSENYTNCYYIENPVGTLSTYWRKPDYLFDPCDYAGYLEMPIFEAYTKKTNLWCGELFTMPRIKPVKPVLGSRILRLGWHNDRQNIRSETPLGFAKAVFEVNKPLIGSKNEH